MVILANIKSYDNCRLLGQSYGPRAAIARLLHGACAVPIKSYGYKAVSLRQSHGNVPSYDRAVALRWVNIFLLGPFSLPAFCFRCQLNRQHKQGPVVQSVVSLSSSLWVISLTVLADSIYNILLFFAEKM